MELSKEQLILLRYVHNTPEDAAIPNYFSYRYNLNATECIKEFWNNGLIEYATIDVVAEHYSAQQIKKILSEHNLPTSGSKAILIKRLISNIDESVLMTNFEKYVVLSDKGKDILDNNLSDEEYYNRNVIKRHIPTYEERLQKSIAEVERLKKAPVKWIYTIRTMKDGTVCEHCKALEGKTFSIKDAVPGVNYPPFKDCKCEFCRCYASHDIEI